MVCSHIWTSSSPIGTIEINVGHDQNFVRWMHRGSPKKTYDALRLKWVRCIGTVRRVRWLNERTPYEGTMAACSCTPVCCAISCIVYQCMHRIPNTICCRLHPVPSYPIAPSHRCPVSPYTAPLSHPIPYLCTLYHRTTVPYPAPYLDLPYQLHTYLELRQNRLLC